MAASSSDFASATIESLDLEAGELAAARQLLMALPDATPSQAVRFLRARKGDVAAATNFLAEHLEWRRKALPVAVAAARVELDRLKYTPLGRNASGQYVLCIRSRLMGKHTYGSLEEVETGLTVRARRASNGRPPRLECERP